MSKKLILFWAWLTAVMLMLLAAMFVFNPDGAVPAGTTIAEMARLVGLKNFIYGCLLVYALVKKQNLFLAILLIARGIGDMLDGGVAMAGGNMAPPFIASFVTGLITLVAGYALYKQPKTESKS